MDANARIRRILWGTLRGSVSAPRALDMMVRWEADFAARFESDPTDTTTSFLRQELGATLKRDDCTLLADRILAIMDDFSGALPQDPIMSIRRLSEARLSGKAAAPDAPVPVAAETGRDAPAERAVPGVEIPRAAVAETPIPDTPVISEPPAIKPVAPSEDAMLREAEAEGAPDHYAAPPETLIELPIEPLAEPLAEPVAEPMVEPLPVPEPLVMHDGAQGQPTTHEVGETVHTAEDTPNIGEALHYYAQASYEPKAAPESKAALEPKAIFGNGLASRDLRHGPTMAPAAIIPPHSVHELTLDDVLDVDYFVPEPKVPRGYESARTLEILPPTDAETLRGDYGQGWDPDEDWDRTAPREPAVERDDAHDKIPGSEIRGSDGDPGSEIIEPPPFDAEIPPPPAKPPSVDPSAPYGIDRAVFSRIFLEHD